MMPFWQKKYKEVRNLMNRRAFVGALALFSLKMAFPRLCSARSEDKEIYFWLDRQMGAAYENEQLVHSFRILSGYDGLATSQDGSRTYYKPTPKEKHRIISKTVYGYSRKYKAEMPYAMQFARGYYIHAWAWDEPLPPPGHPYASHGCVSLNLPDAQWLFNWAPIGTPVYIWGERK